MEKVIIFFLNFTW